MNPTRRRLLQAGSLACIASTFARAGEPNLGPHSTAEDATAGLDLTGRTALVTGASAAP